MPWNLLNIKIRSAFGLTILFSLFINVGFSFGKLTFSKGKREVDKIISTKSDFSKDLMVYLEDHHISKYKSKNEWRRLNKYSAAEAEKSKGAYFAELYASIGKRMFNDGFYEDAFYYLYKANQSIQDSPPKDKKFLSTFHDSYGLAFFYFKRYPEAQHELQLALSDKKLSVPVIIGMTNTYALIFREQQKNDSAKYQFERALSLAKKSNNQPWIGVISGNLGHIYYLEKNIKKAYELCELDYTISMETKQYGSAINALSLLAEIDILSGMISKAEERVQFLDSLIQGLDYNIFNARVLYKSKTRIYQAKGDYKEAFSSYKLAELYSDSIEQRSNAENLKKTEFQINFEQKQAELSILRTKKRYDEIVIYGLIGVTGLIVIVFIWILRLITKRRKRDQELSVLRQEKVQRELENTDRQLRNMLSNLMEKNALIENLTAEIEEFNQGDSAPYTEERVKMRDKLQSFTLLTDDDWLEFKNLFDKLNPNFFTKVLKHSPDLTNAELRLITLIKLNLSNLEMSRTLGISPDSVRKTSLRLRKKWNMDHPEELVKFILSL